MTKEIEAEILQITGADAKMWRRCREKGSTIAVELGEKRRMTSVLPENLVDNWDGQFKALAMQAMRARKAGK